MTGVIKIYTINRTGPGVYVVTATETINLVKDIQNHNDNGVVNTSVTSRQATGLLVSGTPDSLIVYVSSSDSRMGGLFMGGDTNLDTNSGIISRLTKTGGSWSKVDLVRGLPRSEENHATNGLFLDTLSNILYVAQGGNTNQGAPSNGLARLCETALSAAILSVDLNVIDTLPIQTDTSSGAAYVYDLPTVDDPLRDNANGIEDPMDPDYDGIDLHDPFGGNDALNQAKLVAGGPIQIYASGFRNIYDLVITDLGFMYGWDNGPNVPWGGYPANEGSGTATNEYLPAEPGSNTANDTDGLHRIDSSGYYAGHPNPIRGNPDSAFLYTYTESTGTGVFRTTYDFGDPDISLPYDWPPVADELGNPIEGDFQAAGIDNEFLDTIFQQSMNGICEYRATNFDSAMLGDLITTAFNSRRVYRNNLNDTGGMDSAADKTIIASNLTGNTLDLCALGDEPPFPGTIWICTFNSGGRIYVMEPLDFFPCTGADNNTIDEDGDGFTNADEYDNGTNPCNQADRPADFDGTYIGGFLVSDLNDPDDDDDGINDTLDYFVIDSMNGLSTIMPLTYPLLSGVPGTGFYGLGFTGLMMNETDDYLDLWKYSENSNTVIIAGGAAGLLTFANVDTSDAYENINTQHNGFQFGIAVDSLTDPFIIEANIQGPVFPETPEDYQSMGIFFGVGDQDNYVKLVVSANGGTPAIAVIVEDAGIASETQYVVPDIGSEVSVRLGLIINPANGFVRAQYSTMMDSLEDLGDGFYVSGELLSALQDTQAIAFGVIATARGSMGQFNATWEHLQARYLPETSGEWYTQQEGTDCEPFGQPGSCCQQRHEAAYVQSGDKFYLVGGRENNSNVNIYDPVADIWTIGAAPDSGLHHFQAVDYHGLVLAAGAFKGSFPEEAPVPVIRVYDPLSNAWYAGPAVPYERRRGSAGAVIRNDSLFLVGGITNGHINGTVKWSDVYEFATDTWSELPDAPHGRDHFHLVNIDTLLVAAAGRRTQLIPYPDSLFLSTEPFVDVFDLNSGEWDIVDDPLPTPRAANTAAVIGNEVIVIGGERNAGSSNNETEALNIESMTWRTLDSMNYPRNGIQAIENNGGLYVASGARERAGAMQTRSTEAFFMYGQTDPILEPTIASEFLAPVEVDFAGVYIFDSLTLQVQVKNDSGNQTLLLHSMSLFDGSYFSIDTTLSFPRFLKPGDSLSFPVKFRPVPAQVYSDTIYFGHTGANAPLTKIVLSGDGLFNWFGAHRAYVDSSATGSGLGTSWDDAFISLHDALNAAAGFPEITEVWIAKGIYHPAGGRTSSFVLRDSLSVYGGFHGTEILLEQRDIDLFPVVLSGDIGTPGDSTDNVYHVVFMSGAADTARLDGVTIAHGLADGISTMDMEGAGVLNFGKLKIVSSTIRNCTSINPGSALVNSGASAHALLIDLQFYQNSDPHLLNKDGGTLIMDGLGTFDE